MQITLYRINKQIPCHHLKFVKTHDKDYNLNGFGIFETENSKLFYAAFLQKKCTVVNFIDNCTFLLLLRDIIFF